MLQRTIWVTCAVIILTGNVQPGIITKTVEFEPPLFDLTDAGFVVHVRGCMTVGHTGEPLLPVYTARFLLPPGETVSSVRIVANRTETLPGYFEIAPMPEQTPLGSPLGATRIERSPVYSLQTPFPFESGSFIAEESYSGLRIAYVTVYPCRLIPTGGTVLFSPSVTIHIETKTLLYTEIRPPPARVAQALKTVRGIVENPETAVPVTPPEGSFDLRTGSNECYPYLIITSPDLTQSFQSLAELKTLQGLRAKIADLDWIDSNFSGADIQEKIRSCIIFAYENWQTEYVVLGGDDGIIPHRGFYTKVGTEIEPDIPSDLYYAALDGDWNTDGDSYYGEPGEEDLIPEVAVGRIPVDSASEAVDFIAKLSAYSLAPPPAQCATALMAGEFLWSIEDVDTWAGDYKDEILEGSSNHSIVTEGIPQYFTGTTLYDRDRASAWTQSDILPLLNGGVHIINHLGHSSVHTCMRLTPAEIPLLSNNGQDAAFYILYSQGCYAASFDNRDDAGTVHEEDAIGEQFVTGPNGAVAFIGNTRLGWDSPGSTCGVSQFFDRQFFDAVFGEGLTTLGRAFDSSRIDNIPLISYAAVRYVMYEMCLLGDPAMQIWTDEPAQLSVFHDSILVIGQDGYTVEVMGEAGAVDGARVSLFCEEQDIYCTAVTDARGKAILQPQAEEVGECLLSIQTPGHYLFTDTLSIMNALSALLSLKCIIIDDDSLGMSCGDGDGILENGETIELDIVVANTGTETAEETEFVLACIDPFVYISVDTCRIGDIPPRASIIKQAAFIIEIDSDIPNGMNIELEIELKALEGCWNINHLLNVDAPEIVLESWTVTDTLHGNGNGCLEGWEFHNLHCTWRNDGGIDVDSPYIKIAFPPGSWARATIPAVKKQTIAAGGTLTIAGELEYFVRELTPPFAGITCYLSLAGENIPTHIETLTIRTCGSYIDDPVTSGDLWDPYAFTGIDGWMLAADRNHSSPYAWKCGDVSPEPYDNMMDAVLVSPPLCLYENTVLTFWHYVDAEAGTTYPYWAQDAGVVEISTDGGETWQIVSPVGNYPNRASSSNTIFLDAYQRCYSGHIEWEQAQFDLSAYQGPTLIRFHFASDEQYGFEGWYIDDVVLTTECPTGVDDDVPPYAPFANALMPAFPNPFNPTVTIPFEVGAPSRVGLRVYDVSGRLVKTLVEGTMDAGRRQVVWNGTDERGRRVSSGVYFCRLKIGFYHADRRIVLIR